MLHQLGAGPEAELAVGAGQVGLDGLAGYEQRGADLGVAEPPGHREGHLQLLRGELPEGGPVVALTGMFTGCGQLGGRAPYEGFRAEALEGMQRVAEQPAGLGASTAPAQRLAEAQRGAGPLERLRHLFV